VGSGLAVTGVALIACVALLFLASTSHTYMVRISAAVVGFAALVIVMLVGADLSLAHTVELRYY
jgi:sugar phosphate permease